MKNFSLNNKDISAEDREKEKDALFSEIDRISDFTESLIGDDEPPTKKKANFAPVNLSKVTKILKNPSKTSNPTATTPSVNTTTSSPQASNSTKCSSSPPPIKKKKIPMKYRYKNPHPVFDNGLQYDPRLGSEENPNADEFVHANLMYKKEQEEIKKKEEEEIRKKTKQKESKTENVPNSEDKDNTNLNNDNPTSN